MKKILTFLSVAVLALVIGAGCSTNSPQPSPGQSANQPEPSVRVAATIFPLYDIVKTVGGEHVAATLILPPGNSPHTFELTPKVTKELAEVSHIFSIGQGIDTWVAQAKNIAPNASISTVDQGIALHETVEHAEEEGHTEEEEEHGPIDPHYWLNPMNGITIAKNVADQLANLDPEHATEYQANAAELITELREKNEVWKETLANVNKKELITFHDSFYYFADHFGLSVVATFEPFPGKEPTPQYLKKVQEIMQEHNISTLFLEPQLSEQAVRAFANDTGATIAVLDPLGGIDNRQGYIDLIQYNVETIANTLR